MDPALEQKLKDLAAAGYEYWKANATEAEKAAGEAELAKFTSDPDFGKAMEAEMG